MIAVSQAEKAGCSFAGTQPAARKSPTYARMGRTKSS
jgi:hypothetical protein